MPKMFQDVRKKDDKVRTFAPKEPEIYQTIEMQMVYQNMMKNQIG